MSSFDLRLLLASPAFEVRSFLLGLVVGSFANVCIHRLPLGQSVVRPPSRCPSCAALIAAQRQRARARAGCGSAAAAAPAAPHLAPLSRGGAPERPALPRPGRALRADAGQPLVTMALATVLVILALIDLEHQILPDVITLPACWSGSWWAPFSPGAFVADRWPRRVGSPPWFAGMVLGWIAGATRARPRPDDMVVLLAFLGWQWWSACPDPGTAAVAGYLLMAASPRPPGTTVRKRWARATGRWWRCWAPFSACRGPCSRVPGHPGRRHHGLTLLALGRGSRRMKIPLGTFLALGGLAVLFAGAPLLRWYGSLYRG